jgi:hypothetical protein
VLPTAIGNGSEADDTTDVEPPEVVELEVVVLLLGVELEPGEPELPELLDGELLQAASSRHATVAQPASRPAGPDAENAGRFMFLTSIAG